MPKTLSSEQIKAYEDIAEWARKQYDCDRRDGLPVVLNGLHTLVRSCGFDPVDLDIHSLAGWMEMYLRMPDRITVDALLQLLEEALEKSMPACEDTAARRVQEVSGSRYTGYNATPNHLRARAVCLRKSEMPQAVGVFFDRYMVGALLLGPDNPVVMKWKGMIEKIQKNFEGLAQHAEDEADKTEKADLEAALMEFSPWDRSMVKKPTATQMGMRKGSGNWFKVPKKSGGDAYSDHKILDMNKPPYAVEKALFDREIKGHAENYIPYDADIEAVPCLLWKCHASNRVVCRVGDVGFVVLDEPYLNYFYSVYPDASFYVLCDHSGHWQSRSIRVVSEGEAVGVIMPVPFDANVAALFETLERRRVASITV
jgi:hypothetical protein